MSPTNDKEWIAQHVTPLGDRLSTWVKVWGGFMIGISIVAGLYLVHVENVLGKQGKALAEHKQQDRESREGFEKKLNTLIVEVAKLNGSVNTHILYLTKGVETNADRIEDLKNNN